MIRKMKVAGMFYPKNQDELKYMLQGFWRNIDKDNIDKVDNLKGIVSPHAGYTYSGQVATYSYEIMRQNIGNISKNIFILAPDHYIGMNKILVCNYEEVETPFGNIKVNQEITNFLLENYSDYFTDEFLLYEQEHALETQFPFLKYILKDYEDFKIIPLIVGQVNVYEVFKILNEFNNSFWIVSSDLSHYNQYETAIMKDKTTIESFLSKDIEKIIQTADACGIYPRLILTLLAEKYSWNGKLIKYMNSGDTAGDKSQVVGYASVVYFSNR